MNRFNILIYKLLTDHITRRHINLVIIRLRKNTTKIILNIKLVKIKFKKVTCTQKCNFRNFNLFLQ